MMSLEAPDDCDIAKRPLLKDFLPDTWRSLSSKASKVRLVRCPKCRGVLPELADVPVYKCGGCNATLRGKNYKQAQESQSSDAIHDNSSLKNGSEINLKIWDSRDSDISSQESNLSTKETPRQVEPEGPHRKQSESETGNAPHEISPSAENSCQEKEELSIEVGEDKHAENCNGENSSGGSQSPETLLVSGGSSPSDDTSERSIEKDLYSDLKSSSEYIEPHGSKCMVLKEIVKTTEINAVNVTSDGAKDDSKYSGKSGDVSKTLAPKDDLPFDSRVSSSYGLGEQPGDEHAFDKEVPSDGFGEQVFEQHLLVPKSPPVELQIEVESISQEGQETREDLKETKKMNVNVEDENQPVKLPSKPVNRKNDSSFVGDSPLEPVSHDTEALQNLNRNDSERFHQVPYFKGLEKDDPFLKERHINGRRKSADYDHVQSSFRLYLAENHKLDERGQLELLKKLDELRDHLNKSYALGRKPKEHISPRHAHQEKHRPFHGMQKLRDTENLAHCTSCHPQQQRPEAFKLRKSTTYRGGCSHSFQTRLGSECMHRADIPHSHGFHEDCNCLQKYEPPAPNTCYDRGLHQTCTGYKCYNPYSITSSPSRPLRFNCPCRGCDEVQPRHHMQRNFDNEVAKLRHEEKRHGLKQQCRPMVGGAPFITCYHCSQLLKIPEEFLHASKRSHTLQCGSCSKVLMFSLHKTIHIVPHSPKSVLPPSSDEVANGAHQISSAGNSSNADCCIQGDSTSYSEEEYGLPTFKSCSTESEPALPTPAFPSSQINTADQIKPSSIHTALQNCNMKKIAMSILNSKNKHPIDFRKNVGSSSDQARLSLKAEAGHGTGSPLHRLMGYSSPTDIINGTGTAIIPS